MTSGEKQAICREFVDREIWANISDLADDLFGFYGEGKRYAYFDVDFLNGSFGDEDWDISGYFIVSPFLGEKLAAHGETVLPRRMGWIWGRVCGNQAIFVDGVIKDICAEIGLLDDVEG